MQKGLFIGLGGSGVATVARLKALLFQRAYGYDKRAMDNDCSFILYDTDSMSVEQSISDEELRRMMGPYPLRRRIHQCRESMSVPNVSGSETLF